MNKVVEILMRRDGISANEAYSAVEEAREAIEACDGNYEEAEGIMLHDLGLEMDYLFDVLEV